MATFLLAHNAAATAEARSLSSSVSMPVIAPRKRLRLWPRSSGRSSVENFSRCFKIDRLCCRVLPKPIPGSMIRRLRSTPLPVIQSMRSFRKSDNLGYHIAISRFHLHIGRLSLHMHNDERDAGLLDHFDHFRVLTQGGNIIDNVCSSL